MRLPRLLGPRDTALHLHGVPHHPPAPGDTRVTVTGYSPDEDGATFLDPAHAYKLVTRAGSDEPIGLIEFHRLPGGSWCEGVVHFKGAGEGHPEWDIIQDDPLTLSPSILCRTCGSHGYIEGGRWRSA